jgi:hypothetical protein
MVFSLEIIIIFYLKTQPEKPDYLLLLMLDSVANLLEFDLSHSKNRAQILVVSPKAIHSEEQLKF